MKTISALALAAAGVLTVATATDTPTGTTYTLQADTQSEDWEWQGRVQAGDAVEIKGVNGAIRASAASGGEASVQAVKKGRDDDPADVRIEVVEHDGGVTICALYPDVEGKKNECAPGDGGRVSSHDNDVSVTFTVRVPAGVRFVGHTVNGDVEAKGLGADARAATVNGDVTVSTSGVAKAATVNGSIDVSMGRADWSGKLGFHTVNGGITVTLPAGASVDVTAATVNGGMESDFPLTVSGRFSSRKMSGTIGSGGRALDLETVNGSIRLKRG